MAFDVSTLANYTEQNKQELITSSVFGAKTQSRIASKGTIMTGVKSSETINIMETNATFQAGGGCGFNASGTTAITQRAVTVGKIKVHEALCPKDLESKYTQSMLPLGSQPDKIPFEQLYSEKKAALIAAQLETALWQGDTASGNANLARFDGFIKLIDAASGVVDGNTGGVTVATGITEANVRAIVNGVYKAIPVKLLDKDDLEIVCGWDVFRTFIMAMVSANLYHYDAASTDGEIVIPGTNTKLVALNGLNGTNRIFALRWSNMYLGTDLENEEEKFEIFHAKEADQIRFMAEWKTGVNFAFPDEITSFKLVP